MHSPTEGIAMSCGLVLFVEQHVDVLRQLHELVT